MNPFCYGRFDLLWPPKVTEREPLLHLQSWSWNRTASMEKGDAFVQNRQLMHSVLHWLKGLLIILLNWMDYVRHGEIQGRYLVFFKAHGPVFYHVWHSPYSSHVWFTLKKLKSWLRFLKSPKYRQKLLESANTCVIKNSWLLQQCFY